MSRKHPRRPASCRIEAAGDNTLTMPAAHFLPLCRTLPENGTPCLWPALAKKSAFGRKEDHNGEDENHGRQ